MASSSLLTKILADFQLGFYLLNLLLNHATNHSQNRFSSAKKTTFLVIGQLGIKFSAVNCQPNIRANEKTNTNNFDCTTSCKL